METEKEFIPVTVGNSHITTIGGRLFMESVEFIRDIMNDVGDTCALPMVIAVPRGIAI